MKTFIARPAGAWIVLAILFVSGCATTEISSPKADGRRAAYVEPGPPEGFGRLSDERRKFAEALAHYSVGKIHEWRREGSEALKEWREVIRLDPSRSELRERIAQEYFHRQDYKGAAEVLEIAVRQDPKSVASWNLLAIAYRSDRQFDKAVEAAEKAIRLDRGIFPAYQILFEAAIEQGNLGKARKALDRAAAQKSDDSRFWLRLADLYSALGAREPKLEIRKEEIIRFYDRAVALQPDEPDLLTHVADYHVQTQNTPRAIELYLKILEIRPNALNIREKLALSYVLEGRKKEAIQVFEEIVKREPLRSQIYKIYLFMGELHEDLKNFDEALANFRRSLGANPDQLTPYLRIAMLELHNKRPENAIKQLDAANEKFPNTFQVRFLHGLVYSDLKEYARAVESFEQALKLVQSADEGKEKNGDGQAPGDSKTMIGDAGKKGDGEGKPAIKTDGFFHFCYGAALERNGQFEQAVVQFQKALELNPDYADAYNYLGFMYADKNIKLDEATHLIERALDYEPENGAFLDSMGWVFFRQGKLDQALTYLRRAIKFIRNEDAVVFDHLGDVYLQMGNPSQAVAQYEKAAELDPQNKSFREKLENARRAISNPAPASSSVAPAQ